ncbi:MAG: type II secretion system protein [Verrucomicrobiota bacterium]
MKRSSGFTLIELLVVISIIGILASLAIPAVLGGIARAQMAGGLSNMKQLHLTCMQMALDGTTTGDATLGWPGNTNYTTFVTWRDAVVGTGGSSAYLSSNDFMKIMSVAGALVSTFPTANNGGIHVCLAGDNDDGSVVVFNTKNITGSSTNWTMATNGTAALFGNRGFVVFRKGGDGSVYLPKQITNTTLVGTPATNTTW